MSKKFKVFAPVLYNIRQIGLGLSLNSDRSKCEIYKYTAKYLFSAAFFWLNNFAQYIH